MCYPLSPSNGPFSLFSQAARTSFTTESGNLGTAQAEATRYGLGDRSRTRESGSKETSTGGVRQTSILGLFTLKSVCMPGLEVGTLSLLTEELTVKPLIFFLLPIFSRTFNRRALQWRWRRL